MISRFSCPNISFFRNIYLTFWWVMHNIICYCSNLRHLKLKTSNAMKEFWPDMSFTFFDVIREITSFSRQDLTAIWHWKLWRYMKKKIKNTSFLFYSAHAIHCLSHIFYFHLSNYKRHQIFVYYFSYRCNNLLSMLYLSKWFSKKNY